MSVLESKYHLPHNAIRVDEFEYMLSIIDLNKEYYLYYDLKMLILQCQIRDDKLKIFHPAYHNNLLNHHDKPIRMIYQNCIDDPNFENLEALMKVQYSSAKKFNGVFNETIRDYTEFFAFLGLLPTYYKGKTGGDKRHYISNRLRDYRSGKLTLEEILLEFKYRNSSKDFDSLSMYQINVRPFVVAIKALKYFFDKGFKKVENKILSSIVVYSKNEDVENLCKYFADPSLKIENYNYLFNTTNLDPIFKELGRVTLQIKPYLLKMGYVIMNESCYEKGPKDISSMNTPEKVVFCNSKIGNLSLTPVVGKIFYKLLELSKTNQKEVVNSSLFDDNTTDADRAFIIQELVNLGCIRIKTKDISYVSDLKHQISINPYTDFFDIDDSNYVSNITDLKLYSDDFIVNQRNIKLENELIELRDFALGSDGAKYEERMYRILDEYIQPFNVKWLGSASSGKRLSDIYIKTDIFDALQKKKIVIIIECKAGKAVRSFDERKEIDDITNTLSRENEKIDGVWYWVVNGDSLPSVDEHGGYRNNTLSKSFLEKLNDIQFNISEYMRVPTIVTAFSYEAIKNYILYLYDKIGNEKDNSRLNRVVVPHFWRWSKTFMNLQYVMVHKELRLGA